MPFRATLLDVLACPHCGGKLLADPAGIGSRGFDGGPSVVGCLSGHRFDVARQGYLPLLGARSRTDTGDDAAMVAARERFLAAGHYEPIADAVAAGVMGSAAAPADAPAPGVFAPAPADTAAPAGSATPGVIVELGAGTGYYLARAVAAAATQGLALDSSKYALRRAARQPSVGAVLADAWQHLPVRSAAADAVLSIFAPRDVGEIWRILAPAGRVVVVTPEPEHLAELRAPLGLLAVDADKAEQIATAFARVAAERGEGAPEVTTTPLAYRRSLDRAAALDVAAMGPAARHSTPAALAERAAALADSTAVTVSVAVTVVTRRAAGRARMK